MPTRPINHHRQSTRDKQRNAVYEIQNLFWPRFQPTNTIYILLGNKMVALANSGLDHQHIIATTWRKCIHRYSWFFFCLVCVDSVDERIMLWWWWRKRKSISEEIRETGIHYYHIWWWTKCLHCLDTIGTFLAPVGDSVGVCCILYMP